MYISKCYIAAKNLWGSKNEIKNLLFYPFCITLILIELVTLKIKNPKTDS